MNFYKSKKFMMITVLIIVVAMVLTLNYKVQAENKNYAIASWEGDYMLLARLISGEASSEPYTGQVGVGAVILNRVKDPKFPPTVADVIYQPDAFESVSNGQIWASYPSRSNIQAAQQALNGWDPTYGCVFFWNPYKPVSSWIWSRNIVTQIGEHVFAR